MASNTRPPLQFWLPGQHVQQARQANKPQGFPLPQLPSVVCISCVTKPKRTLEQQQSSQANEGPDHKLPVRGWGPGCRAAILGPRRAGLPQLLPSVPGSGSCGIGRCAWAVPGAHGTADHSRAAGDPPRQDTDQGRPGLPSFPAGPAWTPTPGPWGSHPARPGRPLRLTCCPLPARWVASTAPAAWASHSRLTAASPYS